MLTTVQIEVFAPMPKSLQTSRLYWTPKVSVVAPEGEINGNRELTAMPGYNEFGDPRAVGTEREETRWNR